MQFEKASEISQIDIGNEASAFVEVLVGKSSAKEEDYQVTRCFAMLHKALVMRDCLNLVRFSVDTNMVLT